jgi:hypothetical protein
MKSAPAELEASFTDALELLDTAIAVADRGERRDPLQIQTLIRQCARIVATIATELARMQDTLGQTRDGAPRAITPSLVAVRAAVLELKRLYLTECVEAKK